ncbi:MAG: cytochrome [Hydrocarboniphaga sp.]|uniref:cytochrome P450 n=1 Tax=Hydrocarboniphaga sp. TaxID=2033016 RepID=UPI002627D249|nr:cytochrome P450 [Hydrocarboniphaga sp.]MDB5970628.1 cytochrome [Hydrocarboniphaga sp.]
MDLDKLFGPALNGRLPDHVTPDMVRPYPMQLGMLTDENPFETIVPKLHEGPGIFYSTDGYPGQRPVWIFRHVKDQQAIYMDTEHLSSKDFAPFAKLLGENWSQIPAETDPPMHGFYRQIMNPLFAPKKMAELEDHVRSFAKTAIDKFKHKGECDFMADLAFQFPIQVFLELMGLPLDDLPKFMAWEMKLTHPKSIEEMAEGTLLVKNFLIGVIEERKKQPTGDFISTIIASEVQGRKLSDDEMVGFCFNLFIGGLDTVSTHMGLQFRHLAEHPEHQNQLRANPEQIPLALEEFMRAYAAVTTYRTCIKPVTIGGVQIMPGDKLAMVTSLAGRDPDFFPNPSEVRLDRNPRHTTFATGPHRCVGAPLARRELIFAMEEFLKAIPEFRIKPGAKITTSIGPIIQPLSLPLVWKV